MMLQFGSWVVVGACPLTMWEYHYRGWKVSKMGWWTRIGSGVATVFFLVGIIAIVKGVK